MRIGISTASYYPLETEKALAAVVAGGSPCTEIFFNAFGELTQEYVASLRAILAGGETAVVSIHPFTSAMEPMLFFGDYPRRFEDGLEIYRRFCEAATQLGASFLVLHGAFDRHSVSTEQYLDSYGRLHELCKSCGILLAQENVGRCMSKDPALFVALRKAIPDVAFVLDLKQTYRSNAVLEDFLVAMGPNLRHLHLSDADQTRDCLPVGKGGFDFAALWDRLARQGYQGDAVLELYRHNYDDEAELWDSLNILRHMTKSEKNLAISEHFCYNKKMGMVGNL